MNKTYSELIEQLTFLDRFEYLKLTGSVGAVTFGSNRYLNQMLYRSYAWKQIRNEIIIRDDGCDLGFPGYEIYGKILIHHINPISVDDVIKRKHKVFNPENLITVSHMTHQAIHYGDEDLLPKELNARIQGDTKLW